MIRHPRLAFVMALGASVVLILGHPWWAAAVAAVAGYLSLAVSYGIVASFAAPPPEPPPPGELRKVRITFRCEICGAEVRMTVAPTEDPEPPRHCQDEMSLVTPVDE